MVGSGQAPPGSRADRLGQPDGSVTIGLHNAAPLPFTVVGAEPLNDAGGADRASLLRNVADVAGGGTARVVVDVPSLCTGIYGPPHGVRLVVRTWSGATRFVDLTGPELTQHCS